MTRLPILPPAYRLHTVGADIDPFDAASAAAGIGADGDFHWADRADRMDCAILLHPELPAAAASTVVHVAMVGLGDALGALAPPAIAVQFGWPDRLIVNGALAGGLRLATAATDGPETVPAWQVLGASVAVIGDPDDPSPGLRPDTTTLHDEGAVAIDTATLAESFSRHFLAWVHCWHQEGFAPVCRSWLTRAAGYRERIDWPLPGLTLSGRPVGLDEEGGLLLGDGEDGREGVRSVPLAGALSRPRWTL